MGVPCRVRACVRRHLSVRRIQPALLDANKAAQALTGCDRKKLLDRRIEDFHPRARHERAIEHFQKFLGKRGFSYNDLPIETEDEGPVPVEVRGQVIGFDERKAVLIYFRDLSEERLLQREVLFQSHKLTALNSLSSALSKSLEL